MRLLILLAIAHLTISCGHASELAGQITIGNQSFAAADVIAWQQPSPLDGLVKVITVTIAAASIDHALAVRSLQRFGFFAPAALHLQLTILEDGQCQSYDVGSSGSAARFWTGKRSDLICNIEVAEHEVSGSVATGDPSPVEPLPHAFDLNFRVDYLQW